MEGEAPPRSRLVRELFCAAPRRPKNGVENKKPNLEGLRSRVEEAKREVREDRATVADLKRRLDHAARTLVERREAARKEIAAMRKEMEGVEKPAPLRRVPRRRDADLKARKLEVATLAERVAAIGDANARTERRDRSNEQRLGDAVKHNAARLTELSVLLELYSSNKKGRAPNIVVAGAPHTVV